MKIWLDDTRAMPPFYDVHVKTADEAIEFIKKGEVTHISLDYDLGYYQKTGLAVANYIEQHAEELNPINLRVHTSHIAGRKEICEVLQRAYKKWHSDKKPEVDVSTW